MKEKNNERKERKERNNSLPNLPENVIYEILVRIPAKCLHYKFRYICKSWYNIICSSKFVKQNTIWSKPELLTQIPTSSKRQYYSGKSLEMEGMKRECEFRNFGMCRMGRIRSSCNGMLLINDPKKEKVLHVMNLVTKCLTSLPPCPSGCRHKNCGSALGFNPSTEEYKVVHMYSDGFGFEIFTLGCSNNKWKRIPGPFKYDRPFDLDFKWSDPVSINGQVLHWYVDSPEYLISMDVSNEKSSNTYLPDIGDNYNLLEMDSYLSCVYRVSSTQIDVWILKDFYGQVWFKRHSIVTELITYTNLTVSSSSSEYKNDLPDLHKLIPLASLRNGEVILFKHKKPCTDHRLYLYDTKFKELRKLKMKIKDKYSFVPHRSSLIWWKFENEKPLS